MIRQRRVAPPLDQQEARALRQQQPQRGERGQRGALQALPAADEPEHRRRELDRVAREQQHAHAPCSAPPQFPRAGPIKKYAARRGSSTSRVVAPAPLAPLALAPTSSSSRGGGATGPALACSQGTTIEYFGEETISVRAGSFDCHHFAYVVVATDQPEYNLWNTTYGDFIFVKGTVEAPYDWSFELTKLIDAP